MSAKGEGVGAGMCEHHQPVGIVGRRSKGLVTCTVREAGCASVLTCHYACPAQDKQLALAGEGKGDSSQGE